MRETLLILLLLALGLSGALGYGLVMLIYHLGYVGCICLALGVYGGYKYKEWRRYRDKKSR